MNSLKIQYADVDTYWLVLQNQRVEQTNVIRQISLEYLFWNVQKTGFLECFLHRVEHTQILNVDFESFLNEKAQKSSVVTKQNIF